MQGDKKILIIEDDPKVLKYISLILLKEDFAIEAASSGEEALKSLKQNLPDLVIADLILPDMNGAEIIQQARDQLGLRAPVIFLTGMITRSEEKMDDIKIKITDKNYTVLAKPFDTQELLEMVRKKLE